MNGAGSGTLRKLRSRLRLGLKSFQNPIKPEVSISRWFIQMPVGRMLQHLATRSSPEGCLTVFLTWKLFSPTVRVQEWPMPLWPILGITYHHHSHSIHCVRSKSFSLNHTQGRDTLRAQPSDIYIYFYSQRVILCEGHTPQQSYTQYLEFISTNNHSSKQ